MIQKFCRLPATRRIDEGYTAGDDELGSCRPVVPDRCNSTLPGASLQGKGNLKSYANNHKRQ